MTNNEDTAEVELRADADVTRLSLIGCTKQKRDEPARAGDIYDESSYFRKRRRYSNLYCDDFVVISAKHHVLRPDTVIEPYDLSLSAPASDENGMTTEEKREWGTETKAQLKAMDWSDVDEVVVLMGQSYLRWVQDAFEDIPVMFVYPFAQHSGIGEQLGWLTEQNEAAEKTDPKQQQLPF
ncbi:DUF6884 domain-containing protein [Salinibaculum rarum]|uniref:DUF6884 domain-containing protein n=1 Tax=Salinibaculum rarum TaxID=3058903 RepID=UPI00265F6FFD|nr:DUF6884 domain-containing protein [Salinibaculum sp. KK48]